MYMLYICKVLDFSPITRGIMFSNAVKDCTYIFPHFVNKMWENVSVMDVPHFVYKMYLKRGHHIIL